MTRVKRGLAASKRRKKVLKAVKGYRWRRKSHYRAAKEALLKAGKYAYRDRRRKKRVFRSLWITRLNNACRLLSLTYNQLVKEMKKQKIELNRKTLSQIALQDERLFERLIKEIKKD